MNFLTSRSFQLHVGQQRIKDFETKISNDFISGT